MRTRLVVLVTIGVVAAVGIVPAAAQSSNDPVDPNAPAATPSGPRSEGAVGAQQVPPSVPTLYFSIDSESELYTLSTTDASPTLIGTTGVTSSTVGLSEAPDPGQLYGSTYIDLSTINADGSGFVTAGTNQLDAEGLAYDPVNNVLYKAINGDLDTADQTTGATVADLTDPGDDIEGLAWRGTDGRIYGVGPDNGNLLAYTPGTDSWAVVGDTGLAEFGAGALAWDSVLDVLYALDDDDLYRIDPTTATATLIGNTGLGDGGGLAFLAPEEEPAIIVTFTG